MTKPKKKKNLKRKAPAKYFKIRLSNSTQVCHNGAVYRVPGGESVVPENIYLILQDSSTPCATVGKGTKKAYLESPLKLFK